MVTTYEQLGKLIEKMSLTQKASTVVFLEEKKCWTFIPLQLACLSQPDGLSENHPVLVTHETSSERLSLDRLGENI